MLRTCCKSRPWCLWCPEPLFLVLDRAVCQPGEYGALHGATPPPEPARRGPLWEGSPAERRPHGAGWSGRNRSKVCWTSGMERWNRRANEEAGSDGGFCLQPLRHLEFIWKMFLKSLRIILYLSSATEVVTDELLQLTNFYTENAAI